MAAIDTMETLFRRVRHERGRQDQIYGIQQHPAGTGPDVEVLPGVQAQVAQEAMQAACTAAFAEGAGTWRHVLLEEVAETVSEPDPAALPDHLLQVAAVALAWLETLQAETPANPSPTPAQQQPQQNTSPGSPALWS